jgi:hypothetical protein
MDTAEITHQNYSDMALDVLHEIQAARNENAPVQSITGLHKPLCGAGAESEEAIRKHRKNGQ